MKSSCFHLVLFLFSAIHGYSQTVQTGKDLTIDPFSVAFGKDGTLYGVEYVRSNRVFSIDSFGRFKIIAGIQAKSDAKEGDRGALDGTDPLKANFNGMHDLALGPDGSLYLVDTFNSRVRKKDAGTGRISTIAGTGKAGFSGDGGPAHMAQVAQVHSLSFNANYSKLYITDLPNRRIRMIDMRSGKISTVAGNGETGVPKDGAIALKAPLLDPRAVLVDEKENIYILSRRGNSLRVVGRDGRIHTVINAAGTKGYSGDGGPASAATMNGPKHLAMDPKGRILITDTENHCIRRYDPKSGTIELVAGVPEVSGPASSNNPLEVQLARPHGSRIHDGWLYIADSENDRIIWFPYSES